MKHYKTLKNRFSENKTRGIELLWFPCYLVRTQPWAIKKSLLSMYQNEMVFLDQIVRLLKNVCMNEAVNAPCPRM